MSSKQVVAEGRREVVTPQLPVDDPGAVLPRTAQDILSAARKLLEEEGYRAVSYNKVAKLAGVDKGTIAYHFGNKAGLVAAVMDSLIHDECIAVLQEIRHLSGSDDRIHRVVDGMRRITIASDNQRGWFKMLPQVMDEPELRSLIQRVYAWYFTINLEWLGIDPEALAHSAEARGLAQVVCALSDGMAVQLCLGTIEGDDAWATFETMLRSVLDTPTYGSLRLTRQAVPVE